MGILSRIRAAFAPQYFYYGGIEDTHVLDLDASAIYRTQGNVRTVVNFLATNVADLPLKCYIRNGDNDRQRDREGVAARLFSTPNQDMSSFEFMERSVSDYLIYGRVIWLVLDDADSPSGWQLRPIPPTWVQGWHYADAFTPASMDVMIRNGSVVNIPAKNFITFHSYDPERPTHALSPLESIKQTLTEQVEADRYRLSVWKRGGRMNAYITRPKDVMPWSNEQADRFKRDFKAAWTGDGASSGGGVPVLEDGMEIRLTQFNSREAQWAEAKKLGREDVAAAFHVNPSLVWHTDAQTYASAKDNARALYSETLSPILHMFTARINAFLLPRIGNDPRGYVEFDMSGKTQASFEEMASVLQTMCGGPILTRNEGRAKLDLPAIDGGDELIVPMNVTAGGQASPTDMSMRDETNYDAATPATKKKPRCVKSSASDADRERLSAVFRSFFQRQSRSVLPKIGASKAAGAEWWDERRWNAELADDLEDTVLELVADGGKAFLKELGIDAATWSTDLVRKYVRKMVENRAEQVNAGTLKKLKAAIDDVESEPADAFAEQEGGCERFGSALAASAMAFALHESVSQAQRNGYRTVGMTKTWVVTSSNPRPEHAAMDGETVGYNETFSNGARWPGDQAALDVADCANCQCEVMITIP